MMADLSRFSRRLPAPTTAQATAAIWIFAAAGYILAMSVGMQRLSYDIWGALVIGPILATITLPLLRKYVSRDDPTMVQLICIAFIAKMVGACLRYYLTFKLYGDNVDAIGYHGGGGRLALGFWEGNFDEVYAQEVPKLIGTRFIALLTGLIYIVTGPTFLGGFLIYSLFSFWGMYFFYRALRTAFPEANYRLYAKLLFFLPSLLYWPSSIGKEAWMGFTIGLATYGVAMIVKHNQLGYPVVTLGLVGTAMVRPHITLLVFFSLFFAYLMRRKSWKDSRSGPFGRWIGIAALLIGGGVVLSQTASFFEVDAANADGANQVFEHVGTQSGQGGSQFQGTGAPASPTQFFTAIQAVLFRPYLWEAGEPQMLVAALEGTFLLGMMAVSWRRLARLPGYIFRVPYVAYVLAYVMMFVFAFSAISNFGIMTRQRTQVFPFVLVLLCLPAPRLDDGDDLIDDGYKMGRPRDFERVRY